MDLFTALKFIGTHICKSSPTEVARFDLKSLEPSCDYFTGHVYIDIDIAEEETQASPGKPAPANGEANSEQKEQTEAHGINTGTNSGHNVVVLELSDSTKSAEVSIHVFIDQVARNKIKKCKVEFCCIEI